MARAKSLSGTPDRSALPERLGTLSERLDDLEDPEGAPAGGGFIIVPDADREGVLNIETSDGKKWQIIPPLVLPEDIDALKAATTPDKRPIDLINSTGTLTVTRIGTRCHLSGRINVTRSAKEGLDIGQIPSGFLPAPLGDRTAVSFAIGSAWEGFDPVARATIGNGGLITIHARPGAAIDPRKVRVSISGRTSRISDHGHGKTEANDVSMDHTHSIPNGRTGAAGVVHRHATNPAGGHDHSFWGESSGEFAQDPVLIDNATVFPTWFDLDGCTWDTQLS
ncbi:hypothetical protein RCO28_37980 [Streptomyces sp. LHD-70]|uniref:hypothetical protein n=1 Tax=Streptomyces sp. LHD-70 TaxID=3072140 RepID=UPI00280EF9EA|nr:hypothetical protein [Streptomyces sp. LHD-70]MDQ8708208.1 hypothetical protein [Streptomyces sp. LHD-70]